MLFSSSLLLSCKFPWDTTVHLQQWLTPLHFSFITSKFPTHPRRRRILLLSRGANRVCWSWGEIKFEKRRAFFAFLGCLRHQQALPRRLFPFFHISLFLLPFSILLLFFRVCEFILRMNSTRRVEANERAKERRTDGNLKQFQKWLQFSVMNISLQHEIQVCARCRSSSTLKLSEMYGWKFTWIF